MEIIGKYPMAPRASVTMSSLRNDFEAGARKISNFQLRIEAQTHQTPNAAFVSMSAVCLSQLRPRRHDTLCGPVCLISIMDAPSTSINTLCPSQSVSKGPKSLERMENLIHHRRRSVGIHTPHESSLNEPIVLVLSHSHTHTNKKTTELVKHPTSL